MDKLIHLVKACNVNPEQVEIEITETTALNHKEELIKILNQLKSYHFKVASADNNNTLEYNHNHELQETLFVQSFPLPRLQLQGLTYDIIGLSLQ